MKRALVTVVATAVAAGVLASTTTARDRPFSTADLIAMKWAPTLHELDTVASGPGLSGGGISKTTLEKLSCMSTGNPAQWVDMSCDEDPSDGDFSPDNELSIAVNPTNGKHLVAGSNDYFYRFNNSTGARQATVPTGFFTSFDGGKTWKDGQIPMRSGNGAGDPAPAFDRKNGVVMMAQLENTGGQGGPWVSQGDVSVSRSTDGGLTWSEPVTVMMGTGTGIGPANNAVFWDKEWLTVDNTPGSPYYGRAYLTATRFLNGIQGSYAESPIYLSYSDNGGTSWSTPQRISGQHPSCTYQETGTGTECDEDQFSIPEVASDGTVYVHFANGQNQAQWDGVPFDFDTQIMLVKSTDGGVTFGAPVQVAQLEDGTSDMPRSVIGRQTIWGHQIRWTAIGNVSVSPANPRHLAVVYADRGTANPNRGTGECVTVAAAPPNYDPCNAGPGTDTDVRVVKSYDAGVTWTAPVALEQKPGHAWFPWADHKADGTLVVAWDQDDAAAPADTFHHVLKMGSAASTAVGPTEKPDVSLTHWSGQYVPQAAWPTICGPAGSATPGKACNAFHGDYTGLAVGPDGKVNIVWTGLNTEGTSPQIDPYTGAFHTGNRQDAMFARR